MLVDEEELRELRGVRRPIASRRERCESAKRLRINEERWLRLLLLLLPPASLRLERGVRPPTPPRTLRGVRPHDASFAAFRIGSSIDGGRRLLLPLDGRLPREDVDEASPPLPPRLVRGVRPPTMPASDA